MGADAPKPNRADQTLARLALVLRRMTAEWQVHNTSTADHIDNVALYLLCAAGLVEERLRGRAWGERTALDFEATATGVWIDGNRRSILPEELRASVPARANQPVAVQLDPQVQARLTILGDEKKRQLDADPSVPWFSAFDEFTLFVIASQIRGRVTVRLLGNEGPPPGAVAQDRVEGPTVEALRDIAAAIREGSASATGQPPAPNATAVGGTEAISASVVLQGPGKPVLVRGKEKPALTTAQFDVVQALLAAGEAGLTKDELDRNSRHGDARKVLKRLADSDADWRQVISLPGVSGGGYRIV